MNAVKMFCSTGDGEYNTNSFGLYTQMVKGKAIFGTEEDIIKYEKLVNTVGVIEAVNTISPTKEDKENAKKEAVVEMKRIASLYGLEIEEDDFDSIYSKYFDRSKYFVAVGYFDKFMFARILHYKMEMVGI